MTNELESVDYWELQREISRRHSEYSRECERKRAQERDELITAAAIEHGVSVEDFETIGLAYAEIQEKFE